MEKSVGRLDELEMLGNVGIPEMSEKPENIETLGVLEMLEVEMLKTLVEMVAEKNVGAEVKLVVVLKLEDFGIVSYPSHYLPIVGLQRS